MIKRALLGAAFVAATVFVSHPAHADEATLRSCPAFFGGNMFVDVNVPTPPGTYYVTGPGFPLGSTASCWDYTWFKANTLYSGPIYFSARQTWNGPTLTDAGACSHSNIEYGVFGAPAGTGAPVTWKGGGLLWGKLSSSGICSYSVTNWPVISWGSSYVAISGSSQTEYWIGVRQWSHNHDGTQCADPVSCSWSPRLRVGKEPF